MWGDLKVKIQVVKPAECQQPAGIKLTLLPFQRESLHWMKKQEEGPWKGGMLAVRPWISCSYVVVNFMSCLG